jgi:circadian clock protein KaiB
MSLMEGSLLDQPDLSVIEGSSNAEKIAKYRMILFVAGDEPNSRNARGNLGRLCDAHLRNSCEVEVVDVLKDYRRALENRVLITPALVLVDPPPPVRTVGTLNDQDAVLTAMRLPVR